MNGVDVGSNRGGGGGGARPAAPMPNPKATHPDAFAHGCGRKDCFRGAAAPDCEFHGNLVRDIIRSRREERRARLQQRCRTHSDDAMAMAAAAAAASASRSVTPLRRRQSQGSSRPGSPQSFASSEFSLPSCVSPLMEDLMLEVTDAIESSGPSPRTAMPQQRTVSAFDLDDVFRLIEEARREYESLSEPPVELVRHQLVDVVNVVDEVRWARKNSWESLLGPP